MSKRKYSKEFKQKVLKEHEAGASFYFLEKKYGITLGTVKRWNFVIIYTMLKQGTLFDESCFEARRKSCEQKQLSRYRRELEKQGCHVEAQA